MDFKNQSEMFNWIYENREWKSEIDGSPLPHKGHPQWHFCFGHVLSKGAYPRYRLNPENILLMTPDQHMRQESFEVFQERKDHLKQQYYNETRLKKL